MIITADLDDVTSIIGRYYMKAKDNILTIEEREVLISAAPHPSGQHFSNTEIGQRLGISATRVKTLIHQACAKLEADNRNKAIYFAVVRGEIRPDEIYTLNEMAELFSAYHPDMLRMIMRIEHEDLERFCRSWDDKQIIYTMRIKDAVLTKSERDVLILVGRGLTNKEVADALYISINAVSTYLYRICTKLGAHNRVDAVVFALKRGEVRMGEIYPLRELLRALSTLEAESLEKIAQLLSKKPGQELVTTSR